MYVCRGSVDDEMSHFSSNLVRIHLKFNVSSFMNCFHSDHNLLQQYHPNVNRIIPVTRFLCLLSDADCITKLYSILVPPRQ